MSAADRPSEYLKRTCLICGCNTNQTINIYEPRSGPNIVELIQAKFKFQPLNEDKYLCFSCNNWLINWHSLQANSNDADSPSGTFRSSQVNGGMAQEKRAEPQQSSRLNQQQKQSQLHDPEQPELETQQHQFTKSCRPIALIRPRMDSNQHNPKPKAIRICLATQISASKPEFKSPIISEVAAPVKRINRNGAKRTTYHLIRSTKKILRQCCACRRYIVLNTCSASGTLKHFNKPKRRVKCHKCRFVYQWRLIYGRSLNRKEKQSRSFIRTPLFKGKAYQGHVENTQKDAASFNTTINQSQYLKRPLVDGKVVAMLRRLGTTLSRENNEVRKKHTQPLPPIMSPTKPKPHWTRSLEANEILLHFETAISEVLPIVDYIGMSKKQAPTRRKLTYQISCGKDCEKQTEPSPTTAPSESPQNCITSAYQNILSSLPRELYVSLV